MKKVIFGSAMFLASSVSAAVILGTSMANDWTINGQHSAMWNISRYGLTPALYLFAGIAVLGPALALWGLIEKRD